MRNYYNPRGGTDVNEGRKKRFQYGSVSQTVKVKNLPCHIRSESSGCPGARQVCFNFFHHRRCTSVGNNCFPFVEQCAAIPMPGLCAPLCAATAGPQGAALHLSCKAQTNLYPTKEAEREQVLYLKWCVQRKHPRALWASRCLVPTWLKAGEMELCLGLGFGYLYTPMWVLSS